ncbi:MAG: hypothetical protein EOP07_04475 [Proteobacteria bacterium]|nr:MAG: hypothetical protein EOP07_04475 [Pseudomonadota bacterium]
MKYFIPKIFVIILASAPSFGYSQAAQINGNTSSEPAVRAADENVVPNYNFAFPQNTTVNERWSSEGQVEVPTEGQVQFPVGGQVTFEPEGQVEDFETGNIPPYVYAVPNEMEAQTQMQNQVQTYVDPNAGQTEEQYVEPTVDANMEVQTDPNAGMTVDR